MNAASDPGFVGDVPPRRRSAQPAPLRVWLRALALVMLLWIAASALFVYWRTPMPTTVDSGSFAERLSALDSQVSRIEAQGQRPVTMILLGSSRMRNVALDSTAMAAAARRAGVTLPLASTVIGVNWGGFERLAPIVPMIERRHPDVLVVMPDLLLEDFTPRIRLQMGVRWLQSLLWGKPYVPFAASDATLLVCSGFGGSAAQRDAENGGFVAPAPKGTGPRQARALVERMANEGTLVYLADVPVSPELAALRSPLPQNDSLLTTLGLQGTRVGTVSFPSGIGRAAHCDYAHIDPAKADAWREPFFRQIAPKLNGLARRSGGDPRH